MGLANLPVFVKKKEKKKKFLSSSTQYEVICFVPTPLPEHNSSFRIVINRANIHY